eukprot:CAMPEP_0177779870 /NCGR_PEP_ID=MMETSP0491_2-20121128/16863_1 /TAXON_ID=63592 /ORGANISM="Tetraselmis chuii, Strain PLY429" /LENGTH=272 /DNA_ID=CAMNT_0019299529 /DNA_START=280 /DNA_END=1095 /DNA_ORIENTATION=+
MELARGGGVAVGAEAGQVRGSDELDVASDERRLERVVERSRVGVGLVRHHLPRRLKLITPTALVPGPSFEAARRVRHPERVTLEASGVKEARHRASHVADRLVQRSAGDRLAAALRKSRQAGEVRPHQEYDVGYFLFGLEASGPRVVHGVQVDRVGTGLSAAHEVIGPVAHECEVVVGEKGDPLPALLGQQTAQAGAPVRGQRVADENESPVAHTAQEAWGVESREVAVVGLPRVVSRRVVFCLSPNALTRALRRLVQRTAGIQHPLPLIHV